MGRQAKPQGLAERWLAHDLDVDPSHLPARFALPVGDADGRSAGAQDTITIGRDAVAVEHGERANRQIVPIGDFEGVAVRLDRLPHDGSSFVISVNLQHDNPDLCVPVHIAFDMTVVTARWQDWGRALRLPLLLPAGDGGWQEPTEYPGKLVVRRPSPRSARAALRGRRSLFSAVREVGHWGPAPILCGTEIIART